VERSKGTGLFSLSCQNSSFNSTRLLSAFDAFKELKEKQSLMQDSLKEVFTNYKRIQEDVAAVYRM
jgi:hypothetical protein